MNGRTRALQEADDGSCGREPIVGCQQEPHPHDQTSDKRFWKAAGEPYARIASYCHSRNQNRSKDPVYESASRKNRYSYKGDHDGQQVLQGVETMIVAAPYTQGREHHDAHTRAEEAAINCRD